MVRGRLACEVIVPKAALVGERFGALKLGWLTALKKSVRSWALTRSVMRFFLMIDISSATMPS